MTTVDWNTRREKAAASMSTQKYSGPAGDTWSTEKVAYLRKRWDEGAEASQIARELGRGYTKDMVLGKKRRLGLHTRVIYGNRK